MLPKAEPILTTAAAGRIRSCGGRLRVSWIGASGGAQDALDLLAILFVEQAEAADAGIVDQHVGLELLRRSDDFVDPDGGAEIGLEQSIVAAGHLQTSQLVGIASGQQQDGAFFASARARASPRPPVAPVRTIRAPVSCMSPSPPPARAEDVAVKLEEDTGGMRHIGLVGGGHRVDQTGQVLGVLLVQRTVRTQVGKRLVGQAEHLLDTVGGSQRQRHAGAFQHIDHAEESGRIAALDGVVGVGDHHLGSQAGPTVAHGLRIAAGGGDVVENPFLVADFFLDVFGNGTYIQPRRSGSRPPSVISSGV